MGELNSRISKRQNCKARYKTKTKEIRYINVPDRPKVTVVHQRWNPTFPYFVEEWGKGITEEEFNELLENSNKA